MRKTSSKPTTRENPDLPAEIGQFINGRSVRLAEPERYFAKHWRCDRDKTQRLQVGAGGLCAFHVYIAILFGREGRLFTFGVSSFRLDRESSSNSVLSRWDLRARPTVFRR